MVAYAQEHGVILRPQADMYGSDGWFRISIGTAEENKLTVKLIREFLTK
jgi:histidinol-phosphate/aromatic aminotransferase/cobyric acid decarboxylase-like protein